MSPLGEHLFQMLNEQNDAYRQAYARGREDGYREGFRDGTQQASDKSREILNPPVADLPEGV